jgi:hypothetical protein
MSQQLILKRKLTISEILREYGKKYTLVQGRYSDLVDALNELKHAGIDGNLLIDLNDSDLTFDGIADYLVGMENDRLCLNYRCESNFSR